MKKRVIFIDDFIPSPDKDAGSKSTYQYIMLFHKMNFEILFISDKIQLNDDQYIKNLLQKGIRVIHGFSNEKWKEIVYLFLLEENIVFINRINNLKKYGYFIKKSINAKILYYGHDLRSLRKFRQFKSEGGIRNLIDAIYWNIVERFYHSLPDVVYYPSSVETRLLNRQTKNLNVKKLNLFYIEKAIPKIHKSDFIKREGIIFVGGFKHKPNLDGILWFFNKIYPNIKSDIIVHIVGSNITPEIKKLNNGNIIVHGFLPDSNLDVLYRSVKMAIVPLRYGAGVKGKLLEAMFYGLPVISTSIGAEGLDGLKKIIPVLDKPEEFASAIDAIYNENKTLSDISKKIIDYVNLNFSKKATMKVIKNDLLSLH